MTQTFTLLIPSAYGLEAVVARQLAELGYYNAKAYNGRLKIENCDFSDVAKLNMWLRSGERVLINAAEFPASTFDELYEGLRKIEWASFLDAHSAFKVVTKTVDSKLTAHHSIQSTGKKAIAEKLGKSYGTLPEDGAETEIELAFLNDTVSVNLDTSGDGLHKRGYRSLAYTAPLKETTAAALIDLSVWNAEKNFTDIFCGSGTLPIEAALKALNKAPGLDRRFAYCSWSCAPKNLFENAAAEAKDKFKERKLEILGADVNPEALRIAEYHARRAGVDKYLKFNLRDAKDFVSRASYGVNISNPPYGERLGDEKEVRETAKMLGNVYRKLDKWNFYFLTPFADFEKCFNRRADKKRYIFNAGIKCSYYSFNGPKPIKENFFK